MAYDINPGDFEPRNFSFLIGIRLTRVDNLDELSWHTKAVSRVTRFITVLLSGPETDPEIAVLVDFVEQGSTTNETAHLDLLALWQVVQEPVGKSEKSYTIANPDICVSTHRRRSPLLGRDTCTKHVWVDSPGYALRSISRCFVQTLDLSQHLHRMPADAWDRLGSFLGCCRCSWRALCRSKSQALDPATREEELALRSVSDLVSVLESENLRPHIARQSWGSPNTFVPLLVVRRDQS